MEYMIFEFICMTLLSDSPLSLSSRKFRQRLYSSAITSVHMVFNKLSGPIDSGY